MSISQALQAISNNKRQQRSAKQMQSMGSQIKVDTSKPSYSKKKKHTQAPDRKRNQTKTQDPEAHNYYTGGKISETVRKNLFNIYCWFLIYRIIKTLKI